MGLMLQGVSAAVVWTVGLALLVDTVGEGKVGQAMGYITLSMSFGVLVAPLLGGVVYERGGYYSVFGMAFGLVGLDIALRLVLVEKKIADKWSITGERARCGILSTSQGVSIEQTQEHSVGARDASPPGGAVGSSEVEGSSGFLAHLPPVITMLMSRRLLASLWGCLVQASLMTSFDSVIPLFVKRVFGWNSTGAGIIFLAIIVPSFLSPLVGTCLALVMPPLMAEVTYVVSQKERKTPRIFGGSGAYGQAVRGASGVSSLRSSVLLILVVVGLVRAI
ncbi:hypothetical protein FGG08_002618 [Glutinoglossum americanum]|uniref:Major facilitator superfamily (MFS) profile domain-containing protein n=1 Tax=Glutinoglossum americanum TaxID=1670608 RepID=A0A9P8L1G3_9PEZI|nr:hypothetical protein FGG08_002618 [Glutinoglossum americanum]